MFCAPVRSRVDAIDGNGTSTGTEQAQIKLYQQENLNMVHKKQTKQTMHNTCMAHTTLDSVVWIHRSFQPGDLIGLISKI